VPTGVTLVAFEACSVSGGLGAGGSGGGTFGTTVSSASGTGGLGVGSGGGAVGNLGAPCGPDGGCNAGLSCVGTAVTDPIFGGGAPNGICTKACGSDADCAKAGGVCFKVDPNQNGECALACAIGPAIDSVTGLFTPLSSSKCLGRSDLRCDQAAGASSAVCLPTCGEDTQCAGRYCDPRAAVCVQTPNTGLPTGAACDPAENPTPCAGVCVLFQTGVAMCSSPCVLGATVPDGGSAIAPLPDDCGGPAAGLCAFHPVTHGAGDTGYCTPSCTKQSDCQTPSFWCFAVPELTASVNKGYCFAATPCANGQGDCAFLGDAGEADGGDAGDADAAEAGSTSGRICTSTPVGSFCLDPSFPVDLPFDAGTADGATSDGADAGDGGLEGGGSEDGGDASVDDAGDASDGG
jgi:hypothetical protein